MATTPRRPHRTHRVPPVSEWPDLAAVTVVALLVEVGLRTLPLPRLARLVGAPLDVTPRGPAGGRPDLDGRALRRERSAVRVMRHWPWGDTCLRRALVVGQRLQWLRPVLRVGVAKLDGEVSAHAWLEVGGAALDPSGAASFVPLQWSGTARPARRGDRPSP